MKKTTFGIPLLMAALIVLSACDGTVDYQSVTDGSDTTTAEQAEQAGETQSEPDDTVVDNTPVKIDAPQCGYEKVNDRGQIAFAPGQTGGTIQQSVLRDEADLYRIDVEANQRYSITLDSIEDNAQFHLFEPSGDSITTENKELSGLFEETGTHEFCIFSSARNATYTLTIDVTNAPDEKETAAPVDDVEDAKDEDAGTGWDDECNNQQTLTTKGEIRFAAGASSATLSSAVLGNESHSYFFDAREGQRLEISLTSVEDNAVFVVYSPSSQLAVQAADVNLDFILQESGDHWVCVYSTARNATYEMILGIDA